MGAMNSLRRQAKVRQLFCGRPWVECHYCGTRLTTKTVTLDHITPQCKGGNHSVSNLLCACKKCNSRRGHQPYARFVARFA